MRCVIYVNPSGNESQVLRGTNDGVKREGEKDVGRRSWTGEEGERELVLTGQGRKRH